MQIRHGIVEAIGNTPLILLERASTATGCTILGKAEFMNPGQSVKDRAALFIIQDAVKRGLLRPGGVIVEGTAGNTGIGLALVGNALGYRSVIVIPETQSQEKKDTLRLCGAELVEVPAGRFIDFIKQTWPRLPTLGIDLSEAYLKEAKRRLRCYARVDCVVGNGEAIPAPNQSQDAVTSIFLFHELPPDVRRTIFAEFGRVLKPGGRVVIIDSLQQGDEPDYEGLIELFPQNFHEPYYRSYISENFSALARDCGLTHTRDVKAFVSKVMVFDKPNS
jgi:hypothetical protein